MPNVLVLALLVLLSAPASAQAVEVEILATTLQKAPGTGLSFTHFYDTTVGPSGEVAFIGATDRGGVVYRRDGRKIRPVAGPGKRARGLTGYRFASSPNPIGFDDDGRFYFLADAVSRRPGKLPVRGVWRTVGKRGLEPVIVERQPVPGDEPVGWFPYAAVGSLGHVALLDEHVRVLVASPDRVVSVAASRATPPQGTPLGSSFTSFRHPLVDASGRVAFEADVDDDAAGIGRAGEGVWRTVAGAGLAVLAVTGAELPGAPGVEPFTFDLLRMNRAGVASIHAWLTHDVGGVGPLDDETLQLPSGDAPADVALRSGMPALGSIPGGRLERILEAFVDDDGDVVLRSGERPEPDVPSSGAEGLWRIQDGVRTPLLLEGQPVVGAPGWLVAEFGHVNHGRSGDLVVEGILQAEATGEKATWVLAIPSDGTAPIALFRNQSTIELEPGNPVTAHLVIEQGSAEWTSGVTGVDGGVVALRAGFDGVQGIVAITIPEAQ